MKVLVAYASRHGATKGIAERIAATLAGSQLDVTLASVDQAGDIAGYDAFVIGSAAYVFHWLRDAGEFVRRHRSVLAHHPVWLFSSGPTEPAIDATGTDSRSRSTPSEFTEFRDTIHPRDARVFSGAYDPDAEPVGFAEKLAKKMPASWRDAIPSGDFRDWQEIDAWARGIARELTGVPATAG